MQDINDCWGKIHFTGRVEKNILYKFYQIAEIGVMPSLHEQCSYVAIEMMMFSIPLIATTTTGLNEMISNGVNGWKVSIIEKDKTVEIPVATLKDIIIKVLSGNQKLYKDKIRKAYIENYTITQMYEK